MHPIWLPVDQPINQPYGPWDWNIYLHSSHRFKLFPGIPTIIKTMGVNITTIAYLRVLIIEIGSTIILMVVEVGSPGFLFGTQGSTPSIPVAASSVRQRPGQRDTKSFA